MKILMVLSDNPFPPDIRVEKEARTLLKDNHEIHLVVINERNVQKSEERVSSIHVHRRKSIFISVIWASYEFTRILMSHYALKMVRKHKCDIIHVHDLPMAFPMLILSKILNKPVVIDFHENYPDMFYYDYQKRWREKRSIRKLRTRIMRFEEKVVTKNASYIIVVVKEMKDRLIAMGVRKDKIIVISNSIDILKMKDLNLSKVEEIPSQEFKLIYVGGFSYHRGIHTLITSISKLIKKIPNIHLYLVGDGAARKSLEELTRELNILEYVTFTGHMPFSDAMKYISISDVGIIPYVHSPQTEASYPHKLTQYMYFKKPLIVSDVKSLKRIVESEKCGLVFNSEDPIDLAQKILEIYEKPELAITLGNNGYKTILKEYNWEVDGSKLSQLYKAIGGKIIEK